MGTGFYSDLGSAIGASCPAGPGLSAVHPEIRVEWLPPYAPDINPEEFCHGTVKQHLRNITCDTVETMQQHIDRQFARLRQRRDMILGFFHHAQLTVNKLW